MYSLIAQISEVYKPHLLHFVILIMAVVQEKPKHPWNTKTITLFFFNKFYMYILHFYIYILYSFYNYTFLHLV